ncbi:hypothetical protein ACRRTK_020696 [Alexandromys fortis]
MNNTIYTRTFYLATKNNEIMPFVLAIPGCQLDSIWNELQAGNGGYTCDLDLESVTRILIWILRWSDTPLIWATPSVGTLYEDNGRWEG